MRHLALILSLGLLSSTAAAAEPTAAETPAPLPAPAPKELHKVAITFDPLWLANRTAKVSVEGRIAPKFGLAGHVLAGDITLPWNTDTRGALLGIGVSPRYYFLGDFDHGAQLGAVLEPSGALSLNSGKGIFAVSTGPYVGYKYTAPVGFTMEAQGGMKIMWNESDKKTVVGPLVHLNLGWAF